MPVAKANMDNLISSPNSNEFFNSISHLFGCILSVVGTIVLLVFSALDHKWLHFIGFAIYGLTLFLSLLSSSLLHFNLLFGKYYRSLGIFDHATIYTLIAGSSTPFVLAVLDPLSGWILMGVVWTLAIFFIVIKAIFFTTMPKIVSTGSYILLSWLGIFVMYQLYSTLGIIPLALMLVGGVFYTVGAFLFTYNKLDLFPPYFGTHEIWHACVLIGHMTMFLTHLLYTLPYVR